MDFKEFYRKNREKIILAGYFTIAAIAAGTTGYCVGKRIANNNYHKGFDDGYEKGAKDGTIYGMDLQLDQIIDGSDSVVRNGNTGLCYKIDVSTIPESDITCDLKGTKDLVKDSWTQTAVDVIKVHAE